MKEDAVSPVVGVMLMLTITVILAAVFASAAGTVFSKDTSPVHAEIVYVKSDGVSHIFEIKSGDPFPLSSVKLVCYKAEDPVNRTVIPLNGGGIQVGERFNVTVSGGLSKPFVYLFYDVNTNLLISSGETPA